MAQIYGGPERREGGEVMLVLESRLDNLKESSEEIKSRLAALEVQTRNLCRDCGTHKRLTEVEKNYERAKGMVIGISSLIGVLWAAVSFVFSNFHSGK